MFLSYEWNRLSSVLHLKSGLGKTDDVCWTDATEMVTDDQFFANIDENLPGTKLLVSSMNLLDVLLDHCWRKVHLTASRDKSFIPPEMEKQSWPVEGASPVNIYPSSSSWQWQLLHWNKFIELLHEIRCLRTGKFSSDYETFSSLVCWCFSSSHLLDSCPIRAMQRTMTVKLLQKWSLVRNQWSSLNGIVTRTSSLCRKQIVCRCSLEIFQINDGDSLLEKINVGHRQWQIHHTNNFHQSSLQWSIWHWICRMNSNMFDGLMIDGELEKWFVRLKELNVCFSLRYNVALCNWLWSLDRIKQFNLLQFDCFFLIRWKLSIICPHIFKNIDFSISLFSSADLVEETSVKCCSITLFSFLFLSCVAKIK